MRKRFQASTVILFFTLLAPVISLGESDDVSADSEIKTYSDSLEVKKMIEFALKNKLASGMSNSKGKCNENVVKAVAAGGLPVWTGANAYYAYQVSEVAPKLGYTDLLEKYPEMTSKEAPRGAILVYSANTKSTCKTPKGVGCGHVEIKVENGHSEDPDKIYFISDYSENHPVDIDSRFKLIAIFIK